MFHVLCSFFGFFVQVADFGLARLIKVKEKSESKDPKAENVYEAREGENHSFVFVDIQNLVDLFCRFIYSCQYNFLHLSI